MVQLAIEGWALGLATGPYCLGACAPFLIPYLFAEGRPAWRGNARILGEFMAGRFVAYALFGALAGWVGALLRPHVTAWMTAIALGMTAAVMLVYAVNQSLPRWRICGPFIAPKWGRRAPFLLGFLIGINVCPPFLVAAARLMQLGRVADGVIFFLSFFLGTSLYLLPILGLSPLTKIERLQFVGSLSALLAGGWFLLRAFIGS
jgi:sulfite exporter TauE/SafE